VAVLRLQVPFEKHGDETSIESFFHAGSLEFSADELSRIRKICETVPTVLDVYLDRPAILAPLAGVAASLTVNFGASAEAYTRVLFGEAAPQRRLPFDIPASMAAVEASRPDVPSDTDNPAFGFGDGLSYD
jgi:beta-glucosidase